MSSALAFLVLAAFASAVTRAPFDELCHYLSRVDKAVASKSGEPFSIRVMWDWPTTTLACAAETVAAKKFCRWIPQHISLEFPQIFVRRTFACYQVTDVPYDFEGTDRSIRTSAGNRLRVQAVPQSGDELPWMKLTIEKAQ